VHRQHDIEKNFSVGKNGDEAPRSKSPTRQSRYGDGALRGILPKANKNEKGLRPSPQTLEIDYHNGKF
jgi:hypothetical protein